MILTGKVKSGFGTGSFWVNKIKDIFKEKYNMDLFLGTLNIELDREIILEDTEKVMPKEYGGDFDVLVKKCEILEHTAYIVRPEKNNKRGGDHPLNIIEIVSDVNIRNSNNLKDDDIVEINIL